MTESTEWLEIQFQSDRRRLEGIALRMLGSKASAEDAVQETWVRALHNDVGEIDNISAWLTTITARICLDRLKSSESRRQDYASELLADVEDPIAENDPAHAAVVADSVGAALMVVLDSMTPEERVAFVLHDIFAVPFEPIGEILDRSPQTARKLASRARARVQGTRAEPNVDASQHRTLVEAFLKAAREGDFDALVRMLHPDVVLQPDEAAQRMGSRPETRGAKDVASILSGGARGTHLVLADGLAALAWGSRAQIKSIIEFTIVDSLITAISVTADEEHLFALDIQTVEE